MNAHRADEADLSVKKDYSTITELSGSLITQQQLRRQYNRYLFARRHCNKKDVLEVACGAGQGLGFIAKVANSVTGCDIDDTVLKVARGYYKERVKLLKEDAQKLSFPDKCFDTVIVFEAIYYFPNPELFVKEVQRVLRKGGCLLICTANKDLPDFNASPFSKQYFGPPEFCQLLKPLNFELEFFAEDPVDISSLKQRLLRRAKKIAVKFNMIPKTMRGKTFLKRLIFGKLVPMPPEIGEDMAPLAAPVPISGSTPDLRHRVIYCVAKLPE